MHRLEQGVLRRVLLAVFLVAASTGTIRSETFKLGLLHGDTDVFSYEISVLKLALTHAKGSHNLQIIPYPNSSQKRIIQMLTSHPDTVNVFFTANNPDRDSSLLRVNIPLTRGLLGHRVLVIKKSRLAQLDHLTTRQGLQTLSIGSGLGWAENEILKAANFKITEATYKNLWPMLTAERFDAFHRGIQEFAIELQQRKNLNLTTLPGVMLTIPFDYFFFVSRDNKKLHDILLDGLERAYESGAFMDNFKTHPSIKLAFERGDITSRTAIQIANPFLTDRDKSIPAKYWHTPVIASE